MCLFPLRDDHLCDGGVIALYSVLGTPQLLSQVLKRHLQQGHGLLRFAFQTYYDLRSRLIFQCISRGQTQI